MYENIHEEQYYQAIEDFEELLKSRLMKAVENDLGLRFDRYLEESVNSLPSIFECSYGIPGRNDLFLGDECKLNREMFNPQASFLMNDKRGQLVINYYSGILGYGLLPFKFTYTS